jgi:hypothetical protein
MRSRFASSSERRSAYSRASVSARPRTSSANRYHHSHVCVLMGLGRPFQADARDPCGQERLVTQVSPRVDHLGTTVDHLGTTKAARRRPCLPAGGPAARKKRAPKFAAPLPALRACGDSCDAARNSPLGGSDASIQFRQMQTSSAGLASGCDDAPPQLRAAPCPVVLVGVGGSSKRHEALRLRGPSLGCASSVYVGHSRDWVPSRLSPGAWPSRMRGGIAMRPTGC